MAKGCDKIIFVEGVAHSHLPPGAFCDWYSRIALFLCLLYPIRKKCQGEQKEVMQMVLPWWVTVVAFAFGALLGGMVAAVLIEDEKELRR